MRPAVLDVRQTGIILDAEILAAMSDADRHDMACLLYALAAHVDPEPIEGLPPEGVLPEWPERVALVQFLLHDERN